jgi:hypothetical protein
MKTIAVHHAISRHQCPEVVGPGSLTSISPSSTAATAAAAEVGQRLVEVLLDPTDLCFQFGDAPLPGLDGGRQLGRLARGQFPSFEVLLTNTAPTDLGDSGDPAVQYVGNSLVDCSLAG